MIWCVCDQTTESYDAGLSRINHKTFQMFILSAIYCSFFSVSKIWNQNEIKTDEMA